MYPRCLAWGLLVLTMGGCFQPFLRPPTEEDRGGETEETSLGVRIVGDITEVGNVAPLQISGVGLVSGLDGTGGCPPGTFRTMLEQQLRKQKVDNVKALLDDPDNALVLVTAFIPPGARKGDLLDVEVTLPPGSKATSLKGGFLQTTLLRNYDSKRNLVKDYDGPDQMLQGHILGRARGPLLVGFGNPDEPAELRRARIWEGGASLIDRPFYLMLKKDDRSARNAALVAQRINHMFHDDVRREQLVARNSNFLLSEDMTQQIKHTLGGGERGEMAHASNRDMVQVRVPYAYRFNHQRYLRIARLMPLADAPDQIGDYRNQLKEMLHDPAQTFRAALRLEALGRDSVPVLKDALAHDHHLVRFAAAEALAYLGSTAGVEELTKLARERQMVRLYALVALAGLDEGVCRERLESLLAADDAELRCGAFEYLRTLLERERPSRETILPRLGGRQLQDGVWLYRVAPQGAPLVHFSASKRAEIVLFGKELRVVTPVKILAGPEFVITAEKDDDRVTVSRISARTGVQRQQCDLKLEDVLLTMSGLGASYADLVDFLRTASERGGLNAPVVVNLLPPDVPLETLVAEGKKTAAPAGP